jgi:DNA polymerase-3 subunit delta
LENMTKKLSYTEFLNTLKSGTKESVDRVESLYHLTGEEEFLKEEAWKKLLSILVPPELKSFNLDLLYGNETSADQIINTASTVPVNAKKRVVVVFDLHKLSPFSKDALLQFLPKLPDSVCLILLSPKISQETKFYKSLGQIATTVEFKKLWENRVVDWISNRVREQSRKMEPNAVRILQESVGTDLGEVASEIEKLLTYVGERETITASDVQAVVGLSRTHTVFQLIDSIGEKNCSNSLLILNTLILSGEKPGGMIHWLTSHLERLILTKEFGSGQGKSLAATLRLPPFLASKYQSQAPNFTMEGIRKGLQLLYQADVDLKSNIMPDRTLMELLVYNLCQL